MWLCGTTKHFFFLFLTCPTTATLTQQMRWLCGRGYLFGQPMVVEIVWETCLKTVFMFESPFIDDIFTGITHFNFEKRKWEGSFYMVFISGLFSAIYVSHYSCENNMWFINLSFGRESLTSLFYEVFLMKPYPLPCYFWDVFSWMPYSYQPFVCVSAC